ncbi:MAG TPA: universal stress protein, partial [Polyangiales bacterium]|nr:universal stress protein [Polyangiales bacterium]
VSPLPALLRGAVSHPRSMRSRNCWIEAAKQQKQGGLARALGELQLDESGVVSEDNDAARAILQEARARNADLVVVGLRRRSWLDRLLSPSVASAVVRGARRSVLVTPLTRSHAQAPS